MPTRKIHKTAYFWPGLPQLWIRGSWAGLLVAVGFTALANVLLLATLVFGEWLTLETRLIGYVVLVTVWLLARWQSRAERQELQTVAAQTVAIEEEATDGVETETVPAERDLLFREAQGHYLSNDWVTTEQALLKLLKQDARDVESRLMLATLWRHQGRGAEALRQLDRVERLEAAEKWQHEIAAERMAINMALNDAAEQQKENNISDALPERTEPKETQEADHETEETQNRRRAA